MDSAIEANKYDGSYGIAKKMAVFTGREAITTRK